MSVLTMDMSSYEVQQNDPVESDYDDEVLCSGWIPSLALQQSQLPVYETKTEIPEDLVAMSVDIFLRKMYSYQR